MGPHLLEQVRGVDAFGLAAEGCLTIARAVPDPPDLRYLRECVGLVMAFLEAGCTAVAGPQSLKLHTATSWRAEVFSDDRPKPRHHVMILHSEEEGPRAAPGTHWVHTRGMRQFGRPDISIGAVPRRRFDDAVELCNRFIEHLAFGLLVPDGQPIRVAGLPDGMVSRNRGHLDDPDFNNVHLEIIWPPGG